MHAARQLPAWLIFDVRQKMAFHVATLEEYAVELEIMLNLRCEACAEYYSAAEDIREGEEDAPYAGGRWAKRHALTSRNAGWFVRSSKSESDLPACLCPACAKRRGVPVPPEKNA